MADDETTTPEVPAAAEENPAEAVQREFSEICTSGGTEVALAHLIARQQRQNLRLGVAIAYTDPRAFPPPPGTSADVLDSQQDMCRALRHAEKSMGEAEFWLERAAGIRQYMTAMLGRKAPPPS